MNILHRYTRSALLKNRTRTFVTIIGIVLSMALLTAVIEGAYSGQQFLINSEIARSGNWHVAFYGPTEEDIAIIKADPDFVSGETVHEPGSAYETTYRVITKWHDNGNVTDFTYRVLDKISTRSFSIHGTLLMFYGSFGSSTYMSALYGFAAILMGLVAFGSISLIYNSFSISVSERTRQFGILKSIGATNAQIRGAVLYEALILAAIGIPLGLIVGCAGIGITLFCLRDAFAGFMSLGADSGAQIGLVLHPGYLAIAAAVCLVTTLIAAWIPAARAMHVAPMAAIRQQGDVKVTARDVKTSKLTEKLFGFEGSLAAKNFRRNRKGYRATVVSLFMSVVLFISASSFCAYLTDTVDMANSSDSGADLVFWDSRNERDDPEGLLKALTVEGITEGYYADRDGLSVIISPDQAGDSLKSSFLWADLTDDDGSAELTADIAFIQDSFFDALCRKNGIDPAPFYTQPMALVNNEGLFRQYESDGTYRYITLRYFRSFPAEVETVDYDYSGAEEGGEDFVPAQVRRTLTVAGELKEIPMGLTRQGFLMAAPYSMMSSIVSGQPSATYFFFKASDHNGAAERMKDVLKSLDLPSGRLQDLMAQKESIRMLVTVVNVFAYGFIILISLIALANVFNTISTSIALRERELAVLLSVGMGHRSFMRMMNYECLIYGFKGLLWGIPVSVLVTFLIYQAAGNVGERGFYLPVHSVLIAVGSVFLVVFLTMLYSTSKLRKRSLVESIKNENL